MRRLAVEMAIALLLTMGIGSGAIGGERFELKKGAVGNDADFVMAFIRAYIERGGETLEQVLRMFDPPFDSLTAAANLYGRHDLNGDGTDELIVSYEHPYFCGSAGCRASIFQKRDGKWVEIGRFSAGGLVEIDDPIIQGWPRLFSHEACVVWSGKKYEEYSNDKYDIGIDPQCAR